MPDELCHGCGKRLDRIWIEQGVSLHPSCQSTDLNELIRANVLEDLMDIIRWTDSNSSRSQQAAIGPSELGEEMLNFDPTDSHNSPNRMDALVHACRHLMAGEKRRIRVASTSSLWTPVR